MDEKKPEEHKEEKKKFKIKLSKYDVAAVLLLVIFVGIVTYLANVPKGDCEVARPGYKCASAKDVLVENCEYWGNFSCDTSQDVSLPQIVWYIGNLCNIQNQYHNSGLDCSNLKQVCNTILERQVCPPG